MISICNWLSLSANKCLHKCPRCRPKLGRSLVSLAFQGNSAQKGTSTAATGGTGNMWCKSALPKYGAPLHYQNMVHNCTTKIWCTTALPKYGVPLHCQNMMYHCTATIWCTTALPKYGEQVHCKIWCIDALHYQNMVHS